MSFEDSRSIDKQDRDILDMLDDKHNRKGKRRKSFKDPAKHERRKAKMVIRQIEGEFHEV